MDSFFFNFFLIWKVQCATLSDNLVYSLYRFILSIKSDNDTWLNCVNFAFDDKSNVKRLNNLCFLRVFRHSLNRVHFMAPVNVFCLKYINPSNQFNIVYDQRQHLVYMHIRLYREAAKGNIYLKNDTWKIINIF